MPGQSWISTAAVLGTTAGLLALDPTEATYFRRTASFHGFNNIFTGNATVVGTIVAPASLYVIGLVRKDAKMERTAGDAVYENDSGVIGSLFLDPNTAIHSAGQSLVDRAYVGKIQARYRLPPVCGGIEIASVAGYMDGLVFARQLLVTGLPQGPFLVATTARGSLDDGNRAQYVINWNLRVSRQFKLPAGKFAAIADTPGVRFHRTIFQSTVARGDSAFALRAYRLSVRVLT